MLKSENIFYNKFYRGQAELVDEEMMNLRLFELPPEIRTLT